MIICEISYNNFKRSSFSTHVNYCIILNKKIQESNISVSDTKDIHRIFDMLGKIFSIDKEEGAKYVMEFYSMKPEQILLLEESVIRTNKVFRISF